MYESADESQRNLFDIGDSNDGYYNDDFPVTTRDKIYQTEPKERGQKRKINA